MALKQGHLKLLIIISVNKHKKNISTNLKEKHLLFFFGGSCLVGWVGGWVCEWMGAFFFASLQSL